MATIPPDNPNDNGLTWADLKQMEFPQSIWVIEGFLPVGLTLLVGKPKLGKSIITQNLALSVASGGFALSKFQAKQGSCLTLCLEDPLWQFQSRMNQMLNGTPPERLKRAFVFNRWQRIPHGLKQLALWTEKHDDCRLVVIDTFVGFRSRSHKSEGIYERDHAEVSEIQRLAIDRGLAIILVTHERKAEGVDDYDRVSGSAGITAAADNIFIFERPDRTKPRAILKISGRNLRDTQLDLTLNENMCRWECEGTSVPPDKKPSERAILEALQSNPAGLSPPELIQTTKLSKGTVYRIVRGLIGQGSVKQSPSSRRLSIAGALH